MNDNQRTEFGDVPSTRAEAKEQAQAIPNAWVPSPAIRAWLYALTAAIVPLLVLLGVFSNEVGAHVLNIAAAFFAIGGLALAAKNTPR